MHSVTYDCKEWMAKHNEDYVYHYTSKYQAGLIFSENIIKSFPILYEFSDQIFLTEKAPNSSDEELLEVIFDSNILKKYYDIDYLYFLSRIECAFAFKRSDLPDLNAIPNKTKLFQMKNDILLKETFFCFIDRKL